MGDINEFLNKIILGDCMEVLPNIPDGSVDSVVTDPPYGVLGDYENTQWDRLENLGEFTKKWWALVEPKVKDNGSYYIFWSSKYLQVGLDVFKADLSGGQDRLLVWHHDNLAKPTNKMYLWTYDFIIYKKKGRPYFKASFLNRENVDVFHYPKPQNNFHKDKRYHPTSKPVDLVKNLVKVSCPEGGIVLDPFMGGGTTAVACGMLKRNFIGIELDKGFYDIANARIGRNKYIQRDVLGELI